MQQRLAGLSLRLQIAARHAALGGDERGADQLGRALDLQLQRQLRVRRGVVVAVQHAYAHGGHVVGIALAQRGLARAYFQMQFPARAVGAAGDDLAVFLCVEAPDRGLAAPVADVLSVKLHRGGKIHMIAREGKEELGLPVERQIGRSVLAGGLQAFAQEHGLLVVKALLALKELADQVVHGDRPVPERLPAVGTEGGDIGAVFVQRHLVGICEEVGVADLAAGVIADVHRGAELQHGEGLALAGVGRGGELRVAEEVQHAVVADAVAGAEVLVRGVVEHAPAEAAGVLVVGQGCVLHAGVAQRVLLALFPGIEGLGREHMAVAFGDQEALAHIGRDLFLRLAAGVLAGVGKVVEGVDVLEEAALFEIAHAGGLTARVELVRQGVGAAVERVVVLALVDAHAPQHDARVIAVLRHHLAHVLHGLILPGRVADVLPAGDFGEDQQTQAVALVDEVLALRIVRGAHGSALQLLLEDARVLALQMLGRGVADVGVVLVAVQAAQEELFAVEIEAVGLEDGRTEAEFFLHTVDDCAGPVQ